ncbi:MAG: glycyl-radical enzyme activating protein [Clostridia bacterium]
MGYDVTVEDVLQIVLQDRPYYRRSGGGVTLSGGEALAQPDFAVALLKACKEEGLHTAMETTGCAPFDVIARYLPYLDLCLMDIKHMDAAKHQAFTSRSNALMLENARRIAQTGQALIIRVPVIPTFNDTPSEIEAIARFAKTLPGVERLHLLPYHRLGQDKYAGLGRAYTLENLTPPARETMQRLLQVVQAAGLTGQIGG